jgi:hypothetical protein
MLNTIIRFALVPLILFLPISGKSEDINYNGMWTKYRVFQSPDEVIESAKLSFSSINLLFFSTLLTLDSRQFEQVENIPQKGNYVLVISSPSVDSSQVEIMSVASISKLYIKENSIWVAYPLTEKDRVKIHCAVGALYLEKFGSDSLSKVKMFNSERGFQYFVNCAE